MNSWENFISLSKVWLEDLLGDIWRGIILPYSSSNLLEIYGAPPDDLESDNTGTVIKIYFVFNSLVKEVEKICVVS